MKLYVRPLEFPGGPQKATRLGDGRFEPAPPPDEGEEGGNYSAEELWTSRNMKPDFSDFVVFEGNAYGFDGGIFASIDLATGDRNWKRQKN